LTKINVSEIISTICSGAKKLKRILYTTVVLIALQFASTEIANCQAWTSSKGTGSFSFSYINDLSNKDYFGHGEHFIITPVDVTSPDGTFYPAGTKLDQFGEVRTQGAYFDFAYSITDKLAVTGSIPYFSVKYTVSNDATNAFFVPHRFPDGSIQLDDGRYHGSFADIGVRVRYNITSNPLFITPFIEYNGPSHDYLFYSHGIVGRHVNSVAIGSYFGNTLSFLPNTYVQGRYGLALDEKILGISRKRSTMELETGYFFTEAARGFLVLSAQITHGGLNAPYELGEPVASNPLFFHHTQITRDNFLNIGFGGQYSLNSRVDFFGLVAHMITARNLHGLTYGLTFGMSYGFGGAPQRPCHC
jgi:hypothetical protein